MSALSLHRIGVALPKRLEPPAVPKSWRQLLKRPTIASKVLLTRDLTFVQCSHDICPRPTSFNRGHIVRIHVRRRVLVIATVPLHHDARFGDERDNLSTRYFACSDPVRFKEGQRGEMDEISNDAVMQ
jgi:hypothetical protein